MVPICNTQASTLGDFSTSLDRRGVARSAAKFGEDKATSGNCVTPQSLEECSRRGGISSRDFSVDFRDASCCSLPFVCLLLFIFFRSLSLSLSLHNPPSFFYFFCIFKKLTNLWLYFCTRIYAQSFFKHDFFFLLALCLVNAAHTRHLYNQRRMYACIMIRERERELRREGAERAEERRGKKRNKRRRSEIYFYGRDGDVLFLHDRIFLFLSRRTSDRERKKEREERITKSQN